MSSSRETEVCGETHATARSTSREPEGCGETRILAGVPSPGNSSCEEGRFLPLFPVDKTRSPSRASLECRETHAPPSCQQTEGVDVIPEEGNKVSLGPGVLRRLESETESELKARRLLAGRFNLQTRGRMAHSFNAGDMPSHTAVTRLVRHLTRSATRARSVRVPNRENITAPTSF